MPVNKACFTTIKNKSSITVLKLHYKRMLNTSKLLGIPWNLSEAEFIRIINKNERAIDNTKIINDNGQIIVKTFAHKYQDDQLEHKKLCTTLINNSWCNLKLENNLVQKSYISKMSTKKNFDFLIIDENELVYETAIANIFYIKNNVIYTPTLNKQILNGTMRQLIFNKYDVVEKQVSLSDLYDADLVFISNALQIVAIVNKINNQQIKIDQKWDMELLNFKKGVLDEQ